MTGSGPTSPSGKNDDNPVVQQVLFTGRFHHDFATVSADQVTTTNRTSGACGSVRA